MIVRSSLRRALPLLVVLVALGVVPAAAQTGTTSGAGAPPTTTTPTARASSIEQQLREAYDDASAAEAGTLDAYKASVVKTDELDTQIAEIDNALRTIDGYLTAAKQKQADAQAALTKSEADRVAVQKQLDKERARLASHAVTAYIGGDARRAQLETLLAAGELRDVESTRAYTAAIVDDQLDAVQRVKTLEARARAIRDEMAEKEATIRTARDAIASYESQVASKRTEVAKLRDAQAAETARQAALLADIRTRKQSYLDRLRALERESDGITIILKTAQKNQKPVLALPKVRTPLEKPVTVESPFGMRLHPIFQALRMHTGVDFDGIMGQPIRSAAAGVVVFANQQDGYGNVVVVDHGDQIATVYGHMNSFSVKVGDVLARGQVLGRVGNTGYSTGPHLHFEYRVSGAPVDPVPLVDFDEPLPGSCEALARSTDPADQATFRSRADCVAATTTTVATTTTTSVVPRPGVPGAAR